MQLLPPPAPGAAYRLRRITLLVLAAIVGHLLNVVVHAQEPPGLPPDPLALASPAHEESPAPIENPAPTVAVSILAGGQISLGTDADTGVSPTLRLDVDVPLAAHWAAPHLNVLAEFGALPGEAAPSFERLETFRSLEFRVTAVQSLSEKLFADLYAELGFATRLPGDLTPRDKTARFWSAGVRFERFKRGLLQLGLGGDQRLDGAYRMVTVWRGALKLYQGSGTGGLSDASVQLVGEAILAMDLYGLGRSARDSVRIGIVAGR